MQRTADSLEDVLRQNELYFENIKRIVDGTGDFSSETRLGGDNEVKNMQTDTIRLRKSAEDSLLRLEFESAERYNLQV
jgi:hypothetical protein